MWWDASVQVHRTGHVVDIDFDIDSLVLKQTSFNYIKQNLDLFTFKDPVSNS